MIKRLYVHIGDHKTGSTSIQSTLANGKLQTNGKSIVYPAELAHNFLAECIKSNRRPNETSTKLKNLNEVFRKSNADIGIISAEAFEGCPPELLDQTLREHFPDFGADARIIAYVRPHVQRLISSFAELVKIGVEVESLRELHEKFLIQQRLIYFPRFNAWRLRFGDRFTLRPMIRDQLKDRDVTSDFLTHVLGPKVAYKYPSSAVSNKSLSLEDLSILRMLHARGSKRSHQIKHPLGWHMQSILGALPVEESKKTKVSLDAALAPDVLNAYLEDAQALDSAFFVDSPMTDSLKKDVTKTVLLPQSIDPKDHFPAEMLRRLKPLMRLVSQMSDFNPDEMRKHLRTLRISELMSTDTKLEKTPKNEPSSELEKDLLNFL